MESIKNQMKMIFMSIPENVAIARVSVAAFASQLDFTLEDIEDIKVAVSEAVSNCIIHGYENNPVKTICITCSIKGDTLEIMVEDEGKGIEDIKMAMQPAYSTDPERMGLGFTFMDSFMDGLKVESTIGKGTRVIMSKRSQREIAANNN